MKLTIRWWMLILAAALWGLPAWAQQQDQRAGETATPSAGNPQDEGSQGTAEPATAGPVPDTRPLSGAEQITAGQRQHRRTYFLPSLQVAGYADSNRYVFPTKTLDFVVAETVVGRLSFQRVGKTSQSTFDYAGGGQFFTQDSSLNTSFHQLGFSQMFTGRRWSFMLADQGSYLPESPFGFGGFGSLGGLGGGFGSGLGTLNPIFGSGQCLFSGRGTRIANTAVGQVVYKASSRSSFTVTGSYGVLQFVDPAYIDSDQRIVTVGYNYALNKKDTIAISYGLSMFHFRGINEDMFNHFVQLQYSRRVTGRVGFELAGGPLISIFHYVNQPSNQRTSWTAYTALNYRLSRTDLSLSYSHYTSPGSGIYVGANTDQLYFSLHSRLTRSLSGSVSPGYSRNSQIYQALASTPAKPYNSVYVSTSIQRTLGRYTDLFFSYTFQDQLATGTSTYTTARHVIGMGFNWHPRRMDID